MAGGWQVLNSLLKNGSSDLISALRGSCQCSHIGPSAAFSKSPRALVDDPTLVFRHPVSARIARCLVMAVLAAWLSLSFGGAAIGAVWKNSDRLDDKAAETTQSDRSLQPDSRYLSQKPGKPNPYFDNLAPEDRTRMQRQYREWQSLPPEQRDTMRQRMDDLRRMPPQDRERYQQRYQQWQQLSPEDRRRLENNLQRWDSLSPQERESIRQRFKN
jgi:hypothetical protein